MPPDGSESPDSQRRYSASEVGELLRRLGEMLADSAPGAASAEGVTLAELEELATRAGLDPESFNAAAADTIGAALPSQPVNVFLALVADDQAQAREDLKNQLEADGHTVVPEEPLDSTEAAAFEEAVRESLSRCDFAVHLVGPNVGARPSTPDGEAGRSALQIQTDRSRDVIVGNGLERIIWVPGDVPEDDFPGGQLSFVQSLAEDSLEGRSELLKTSLEELKSHVQDRLGVVVASESESQVAEHMVLLVLADKQDLAGTQALEDFLEVDCGLAVEQTGFGGTEEQRAKLFAEKASRCDAAIVYYGSGDDVWLGLKLIELRKNIGRDCFRGGAIVIGDPFEEVKPRYNIDNDLQGRFELLDSGQTLDTQPIEKFLERLFSSKSTRRE